jgi:hypothetical protein
MAKKGEMANAEPVVALPVISPLAPLAFREAKTMPECPHEYVVRTPENEAAYVAIFNLIVEQGVHERWGRRKYQYWYPGDGWKYWCMTSDIRQSLVLNRARADTTIAGAEEESEDMNETPVSLRCMGGRPRRRSSSLRRPTAQRCTPSGGPYQEQAASTAMITQK